MIRATTKTDLLILLLVVLAMSISLTAATSSSPVSSPTTFLRQGAVVLSATAGASTTQSESQGLVSGELGGTSSSWSVGSGEDVAAAAAASLLRPSKGVDDILEHYLAKYLEPDDGEEHPQEEYGSPPIFQGRIMIEEESSHDF